MLFSWSKQEGRAAEYGRFQAKDLPGFSGAAVRLPGNTQGKEGQFRRAFRCDITQLGLAGIDMRRTLIAPDRDCSNHLFVFAQF